MDQIFYPADILLPRPETDMEKWSVIACDQFTSEPEYWKEVEEFVGDAPSAFRITLPEVYLDTREEEPRLKKIKDSMKDYMDENLFVTYPDSVIYIERIDSTGTMRPGIIGAIDLEQYDYHKGTTPPVRATEGTILGRIPSRLRVRNNGSIETPHIMMLIDDEKKKIIESLSTKTEGMNLLYDFDLMKGGGHLKGWVMDPESQAQLIADLGDLADTAQKESGQEEPLIYAVGDGNHSLATAKEYYEQLKKAHPGEDLSRHPARFALVEVVNLHSPALEFEAIHRIVTEANTDHLFAQMTKDLGLVRDDRTHGQEQKETFYNKKASDNSDEEVQAMSVVLKGEEERFIITKPCSKLTVGSLQHFLDTYIKEHSVTEDIKVDYIHGRENLKALTWKNGSMGFLLPDMHKKDLFPSIKADGTLPRKTFSMGHAEDKRYYTECRKIVE